MHRTRIVFFAALVLGLAGAAHAHSLGSDWSYPDYDGSGYGSTSSGVSSYEAFYGSYRYGGGYSYPSYTTSSCGGDLFSYFSCTVYDSNHHDYSYSSYDGYPTYTHIHDYSCGHIRPPTNPVPEPSAAIVFGLGALVVGSRSRRRR